jgi:Ca-activated chloride channel family protein
MTFLWSSSLLLLFLIPLLIIGYVWLLRRRKKFVVRYSSLTLVREAGGASSAWRRHVPFAAFLLALTSLIVALARPTAEVTVPSNRSSIILAMDVSLSMCSTDIQPNRIEAAKSAALTFVQSRETGTKIGVVAFAGFAELVQAPTEDKTVLNNAIQYLTVARRTAIGSAILRSIEAISELDASVPPIDLTGATSFAPATEFSPHIIVLLTDGSSNAGPSPFMAANEAALRGIRVYTIGFGTPNNQSPMDCGFSFLEGAEPGGNSLFGQGGLPFFGGGGGGGFRRELDEAALVSIAEMTGGQYYAATSASELQNVFQNLPIYLVLVTENIEISAYFNALGLLLILLAMYFSLRWNPVL